MTPATLQIADTLDRDGQPVPHRTNCACTTSRQSVARSLVPTFSVIDDLAGLDALRNEWLALETEHGASHQMFQSFHWVRHWCDHFLNQPGTDLCIVTARVASRLVMIWPLVQECRLGQCHIKWLGEPVSQYGDALVVDGAETTALILAGLDFISSALGDDIVILRKVRADSNVAKALENRGIAPTSTDSAPYASLPNDTSFDAFAQRYPTKARKNRRRHRRRLEETGPVTFEILGGSERAQALIHMAIGYKRQWLKDRSLLSRAFTDDRFNGFFETMPSRLNAATVPSCQLQVFALLCDGHPVAINVGFRSGDRMLIHIAAYDPAFERFSPGSLLFEASIKYCLENGIAVFDLLSPGDSYKADWADETVEVRDYALGLTRKGRAYDALFIRRLRPAAKFAMARMPRLAQPFSRMFNF